MIRMRCIDITILLDCFNNSNDKFLRTAVNHKHVLLIKMIMSYKIALSVVVYYIVISNNSINKCYKFTSQLKKQIEEQYLTSTKYDQIQSIRYVK